LSTSILRQLLGTNLSQQSPAKKPKTDGEASMMVRGMRIKSLEMLVGKLPTEEQLFLVNKFQNVVSTAQEKGQVWGKDDIQAICSLKLNAIGIMISGWKDTDQLKVLNELDSMVLKEISKEG
jgi:hypothetical protein